jgi:RNA polymerase sigma factor (sigma-70 family)
MTRSALLSSRGHPAVKGLSEQDGKLIQLILAGDHEAFEALRGHYERIVFGLILSVLNWPNEKAEVEDIAQETWLAVYKYLAGFDGRSSFGTWLSTITKNKCYDFLRKKKQRKIFVSATSLSVEEIEDCERWFAEHPIKDSDEYVEQVESIADQIRKECDPEDLPVIDSFLEHLQPQEISDGRKIPIKKTRRILDRFRDKCRKKRVEGMTQAEQMRVCGKASRKRSTRLIRERGAPEDPY